MFDPSVTRQSFWRGCHRGGGHTGINSVRSVSCWGKVPTQIKYVPLHTWENFAFLILHVGFTLLLSSPASLGDLCLAWLFPFISDTWYCWDFLLSPVHEKLIPPHCSLLTSKHYEIFLYLFIWKVNPPSLLYINTCWDLQDSCVCSAVFIHLEQRSSSPCLAQCQA